MSYPRGPIQEIVPSEVQVPKSATSCPGLSSCTIRGNRTYTSQQAQRRGNGLSGKERSHRASYADQTLHEQLALSVYVYGILFVSCRVSLFTVHCYVVFCIENGQRLPHGICGEQAKPKQTDKDYYLCHHVIF
jgi:hypothetical protein